MSSLSVLPVGQIKLLNAIQLAAQVHQQQPYRPKENTPYLSHLLATAALVYQHGGTTQEATAAILHDLVEDQSDVFGGRKKAADYLQQAFRGFN